MHKFYVSYDSGAFWTQAGGNEPFEMMTNFKEMDEIANGFKWSIKTKAAGQRKFHQQSLVTSSIYAMLDNIKEFLKSNVDGTVVCLTPDIEVEFYNA